MNEIKGSVKRVDDPLSSRPSVCNTAFLAKHTVLRKRFSDGCCDALFASLVNFRNKILVLFGVYFRQIEFAELPEGYVACFPGCFYGCVKFSAHTLFPDAALFSFFSGARQYTFHSPLPGIFLSVKSRALNDVVANRVKYL